MAGERLILAADKLSRAGSAWDDFIVALEEETQAAKDNCVMSPLELLQVNQGRAQTLHRILNIMKTCRKEAERLRLLAQNPR